MYNIQECPIPHIHVSAYPAQTHLPAKHTLKVSYRESNCNSVGMQSPLFPPVFRMYNNFQHLPLRTRDAFFIHRRDSRATRNCTINHSFDVSCDSNPLQCLCSRIKFSIRRMICVDPTKVVCLWHWRECKSPARVQKPNVRRVPRPAFISYQRLV